MIIGVPKEIKNHEYRVGLVPSSVQELVTCGHEVVIEKDAGVGIGFTDEHFEKAGARVLSTAKEVFDTADLIIKVKEPQLEECAMLRSGQTIFTYLHLVADPDQAKALLASGCTAIAYETVTDDHGTLPLLAPMSEVAGRMSIQVGASTLEKEKGGSGVLLSGVPGVAPAKVTIIGGGVVGYNAARMAVGLGANVTIIDRSSRQLHKLDAFFGPKAKTIFPTQKIIEEYVTDSDLVVGAVLVPGGSAPRLVTREMLSKMRPGSVLVDVAIDQGGCFETSRPTTHAEPTYVVDDVVHYCVTNMPGAVPRTSTFALNNVTLPYIMELVTKGIERALGENHHLRNGLNIHAGQVMHPLVAKDLAYEFSAPETVFRCLQPAF